MITYDDALAMLERHEVHPDIIRHSEGVAEIALDLATRIAEERPELGVNAEKVRLAALLHDLGRCRSSAHEWHTGAILRNAGLGRIAEITMHGAAYERVLLLEGVADESLLPHSVENKIVAYADLRFCQVPMSVEERLQDAIERKSASPLAVRIIRAAEPRFRELEAEVLGLLESEEAEDGERAVGAS